jgi:AcrR family transcriptional regulator
MPKQEQDRRKARTQQLLQAALAELMNERSYESITIEDITERANVGRTTFYLHYHSKDDLFLYSMEQDVTNFRFGMRSASDWLDDKPTAQLVSFFREAKRHAEQRRRYGPGHEDMLIRRAMDKIIAQRMEDNLRAAFPGSTFSVSLPLLAQAMAGVHIWLFGWWVNNNVTYTAEEIATTSHRMLRALLLDALVRAKDGGVPSAGNPAI